MLDAPNPLTQDAATGFREAALLWIGDSRSPEFAEAYAAASSEICVLSRINAAAVTADDEATDVVAICLAESVPGEYDDATLPALRRRFPVTPVVVIVANWLEGQQRTGKPHSSALRIPWTQAASQLAQQLRLLKAGGLPSWGHGETLTEDERATLPTALERATAIPPAHSGTFASAAISIHSRHSQTGQWLGDLCRTWGAAQVCVMDTGSALSTQETPADVVLWAPSADSLATRCEYLQIAKNRSNEPILALSHFPRPHQVEQWRRWGVAEVLSLPCDVELLKSVVAQLLLDKATPAHS
ncbi:MAG: hypothetical protein QM775_03490 [Pirellulales bacterium]